MKALLLLHGFKRNNQDDFEESMDYFKKMSNELGIDKIYNEIWFNNYDLETLNLKYFDSKVNEISEKIKNDKVTELYMICYSTGNIIGAIIKKNLSDFMEINFYGIAPSVKPHILKWSKTLSELKKKEKQLREKLGDERYFRIKEAQQAKEVAEKYPVKIIYYIFRKVIGKRRKELVKIKNSKFLISETDHIVKTKSSVKALSKNKTNKITIDNFTHDLIFRKEKDIVIKWLEREIKK